MARRRTSYCCYRSQDRSWCVCSLSSLISAWQRQVRDIRLTDRRTWPCMDHTTHTSSTHINNHSNPKLQCTHLVEIWHLGDVDEIDYGKVLDLLSDTVQRLVHRHALAIPVMSEAQYDDTVFLGFDGLIDMPARRKMRKKIRHGRIVPCAIGGCVTLTSPSSTTTRNGIWI